VKLLTASLNEHAPATIDPHIAKRLIRAAISDESHR